MRQLCLNLELSITEIIVCCVSENLNLYFADQELGNMVFVYVYDSDSECFCVVCMCMTVNVFVWCISGACWALC